MLPIVTLIALSSLEDASKFLLLHFRLSWRDESILFLRIPRAIPQSKGCMLAFDGLGAAFSSHSDPPKARYGFNQQEISLK